MLTLFIIYKTRKLILEYKKKRAMAALAIS
jgi:hypothetical protein